jgi:transcriptional regulator with XRE-family HTH domain
MMFLANLSRSLLEIIEENKLTYEKLANNCDISARYMGKIINCNATPSVKVLQKICNNTNRTPNQLLRIDTNEELSFRSPLRVTETRTLISNRVKTHYMICPRCECFLLRHNQLFCCECGQRLKWD